MSILNSIGNKIPPSSSAESNAPENEIPKQQGKLTKSYAASLTQGKEALEHIEEPEIPAEFALNDDLQVIEPDNIEEMTDQSLKSSGEVNTTNDVLVNSEGTPISSDSPMSEFIKSVQFVPLPLTPGQIARQSKPESILISSVNHTAASSYNQAGEFTPRCREPKKC